MVARDNTRDSIGIKMWEDDKQVESDIWMMLVLVPVVLVNRLFFGANISSLVFKCIKFFKNTILQK